MAQRRGLPGDVGRRGEMMKAFIHINQHIIKSNSKYPESAEPPITVKTYKSNHYVNEVTIDGPATVIYRPDNPLSCGAKVWIRTDWDLVHFKGKPNDN